MPGDTRKTIQEQFEALQRKGLEPRRADIASAPAIASSKNFSQSTASQTNFYSNPREKIQPPTQYEHPQELAKLEAENAYLRSDRNNLKYQNEELKNEIVTVRSELRKAIQTNQELSSRATAIEAREKNLDSDLSILAEQETHLIERQHLHEIEGRRLSILSD